MHLLCLLALVRLTAGIQGLALSGVHTDIAGSQRGAALGALLEASAAAGRWRLHLEGIPPVSLPQKPSITYGQATPQFSLFDGALGYALDRNGFASFGIGMTVINQKTPLPAQHDTVSSRLAGARFDLRLRRPIGAGRFVELELAGSPRLYGADVYRYDIPDPTQVRQELAAEEDAIAAYGIDRGPNEWLFGFRTINFAAKFLDTGLEADRNNGAGFLVEWRRVLAR